MKKLKKMAVTVPLVGMLSTSLFVLPNASLAAEKSNQITPTTNTAENISTGKLVKNGQIISLSTAENTSDYYPQPDKDPYKEPVNSLIVQNKEVPVNSVDMIGIKTGSNMGLAIKNGNLYFNTQPDGTKLTPLSQAPAEVQANYKKFGFTSDVLDGTKIKQEIQWKRVYNRLQPKSTQHQWSVAETHGVSTTDSVELAFTVGAEIGATVDDITGKITSSISKKFTTSTTISDLVTKTITDTFPAKPAEYAYNDYRVAIYQKEEVYTVEPGANLKSAMNNLSQAIGKPVSAPTFTYKTDELRPIVTPN
ncbi:hypothetical protein [Bacillus toyonensis]|uniref:hypothetical protein n=1 Tax=Bacillus toyonensis TaxID=155322 RepID=UPI000BFEA6B3|nr:hypothetical protein [Bacillus toyonensis]PHG62758.1 hypothetical protein COI59_19925 [Bacillus toyonensis]